jgi:23S rRNA (cytosine1962-C5)-methyltransferase
LRLAAAAESALRAGHPWVFAESIRDQNRKGQPGELAVIYDRKDEFLALGLFDPDSPIRVRVLHAGKPETIDRRWWSARLAQTVERRRRWFDAQTTGYRLIHGESDGWPGLVLDGYGSTLVLKLYTSAWLPRLPEIAEIIQAQLQPERLVLRLSRNVGRAGPEAGAPNDGEMLQGSPPDGPVIFLETGLRFEADVLRGQKTGFFLDQRENRRNVERLGRGRRVLNAFSFSGGFSLYAARGGADSVCNLDISVHALAGARRNLALNESNPMIARCRHEFLQADAFDWLGSPPQRRFDLIIFDPPTFAKREAERAAAIRAYEKLTGLGIKHLARGGILVAASCSAHVTAAEFFKAVRHGALQTKRPFAEMQTTGHAPDHPATFKEAEYLKTIYLKFG